MDHILTWRTTSDCLVERVYLAPFYLVQWRFFLLMMSSLSTIIVRICIALVAVLITVWSQYHSVFFNTNTFTASPASPAPVTSSLANEWLRDRFLNAHLSTEKETRILLVDIDEASLAALGPWPWPRTRIAELLEILLGHYAARGVALDLVLPEPADQAGDTRLAMLAQHGPVVLAQAFDYVTRPTPLQIGRIHGGQVTPKGMQGAAVAQGFIANHAGLQQASHVGNIGFVPDQDGVLRRLPIWTWFHGERYPTLALALFNCCVNFNNTNHITSKIDSDLVRIPFKRDWSAYHVISASDILQQRISRDEIAGRLVLIGSSSLGLSDRVATPLHPSTPGLLVHAALLSSLLDGSSTPKNWPEWLGKTVAIVFSILTSILASLAFPRLSALSNMTFLGGASLLWLALSFWMSVYDVHFSTTGPLASHLFLLAVAVPFSWQLTQHKSRQLLGTLKQYVANDVVNELLRHNLQDPLTPRQMDVTTLIADMASYTSQVESLPMEEAAQLTHDFLACLTGPVLANRGTLDKYTGDGLVAFWGAPLPLEQHADLALNAAQEIVRAVTALSETRVLAGKPPIQVRIGIESGPAMAGNFGNSLRSIYTAVGDSVNVASRLEQLVRHFPCDILIGPGTVSRATRHRFTLLGETLLRGKEQATMLYTLDTKNISDKLDIPA